MLIWPDKVLAWMAIQFCLMVKLLLGCRFGRPLAWWPGFWRWAGLASAGFLYASSRRQTPFAMQVPHRHGPGR